jgi:hypothetical protein
MPIHSHLLTDAGELFGGLRDRRASIAAVSGEASRIGGSGHRIISRSDCRPLEGVTRSTPTGETWVVSQQIDGDRLESSYLAGCEEGE